MSGRISIELGSVQKTLFLPLWGRACETQKPDPLLVDRKALEIIQRVDFDFSTLTQNIQTLSQIGWIMRSISVDQVVTGFLEKYPRATIVDIGCGLDTTFNRVDNGLLSWYDLDLPDVIELRRKLIPESERCKYIIASFLEDSWIDEIIIRDNVLFIAAGVFYYFEEEEIKGFLKKLADKLPGSEILFDACSPYGVKMANKLVIENAGLDERSYLKWGLKHTQDILTWDERFRILKTIYYFKNKRISFQIRILGYISDLLKIQYMIHLAMGK
jgi:O-methyltransferase involved in polyketide biosynthesis